MLFIFIFAVFFTTAILIYGLIKLAPRLGLIALPSGHRQHLDATPMVGGIALYTGILLGIVILDKPYVSLTPSLLLMCIVGVLDDRYKLPSWCRLVAQAIAAYLMIQLTGIQLFDLGYLFTSNKLVLLGDVGIVVMTVFASVGVINAINMSDGLDGLAGALVFAVLLCLLLMGHPAQGLIIASLSALAGFLVWNLRVGRKSATVFMGDAGSTMLGLLLAALLIQYSQEEAGMLPVTALWLLALPLIDAVAVLIVRPLRKRSPFTADRMHYHHQLLDRGFSANAVVLVLIALQLMFIGIGVFALKIEIAEHLQLYAFLSFFVVYLLYLYKSSEKLESAK